MTYQIKKPSENKAVKLLERKGVIRLFGLALFLAPFINAAIVLLMKKVVVNQPLNLLIVLKLFASGTWIQISLTLASLTIGLFMLNGSTKTWKFVLALLGCHILIQLKNLGHDLKENWLWGPFFLINLSLFFFIADQLVFKLKVSSPEKTAEKKEPRVFIKSKILIHFDSFGPWAQLKSVSKQGLHVQCLKLPPVDFEKRELSLTFKNGLNLKSRFKTKQNQDFFFEFIAMNESEQKVLSDWIFKQSA